MVRSTGKEDSSENIDVDKWFDGEVEMRGDLPVHCPISVNKDGQGPVDPYSLDFDHWECWCPNPKCDAWRAIRAVEVLTGVIQQAHGASANIEKSTRQAQVAVDALKAEGLV